MCMCMCVCMRVSIPPSPSGRSLTQNRATIQKSKKQILLSCLPTISIMISTITSRKQSLGRLSLFPGPLWTTIYVFIYTYPESSSDFAYETTPLPLPAPRTWSRCEYEVQHEKDQQHWVRKKKEREKGKKREEKKIQTTAFLLQISWVCFSCIFPPSSSF